MSYTPLIAILVLLVIGAAATLSVLFYAHEKGYFDNLKSGAYVIFDEDEPVGEPQDQFFRETEGPSDDLDPRA
jgi:hypothetical protein